MYKRQLVREDQDRPQIALTFDDGPDEKYTEKLLDGLKERGIKASFFLLGKSIEGNEHIVKRMHREGHLIGNHTYNHVQLDKISETRAREEILKTNNRIYEITGEYPVYMRPPYGLSLIHIWIARINAAARMNGLSYSKMMHGLKVANIDINRKMLAELAVNDAEGFKALAEIAKKAIA